jgi:hypothetical protein
VNLFSATGIADAIADRRNTPMVHSASIAFVTIERTLMRGIDAGMLAFARARLAFETSSSAASPGLCCLQNHRNHLSFAFAIAKRESREGRQPAAYSEGFVLRRKSCANIVTSSSPHRTWITPESRIGWVG